MLTDPRSFYGYAHVYGSVSCTVGAGTLIPYKRGDEDVGWFIRYRHS